MNHNIYEGKEMQKCVDVSKIQWILFDLDGTLYEDKEYLAPYISLLLKNTKFESMSEEIIALAERIVSGKCEEIPMNCFYQIKESRTCSIDVMMSVMKESRMSSYPFEQIYTDKKSPYIFLGDGWDVINLIETCLGVKDLHGEELFMKVRKMQYDKLADENYRKNQRLIDVLEKLKMYFVTILVSNSPEELAKPYIQKLGFSEAFSCMLFNGKKPYALYERLTSVIPEIETHTESILSIGDHAFNEIVPIMLHKGQTAWISPCADVKNVPYTVRLDSVTEIEQFLENLIISRKESME